MKTGPKPTPTIDRIMQKVIKQSDGCWIFSGAIGSQGYGKTYHEGRSRDAHRVMWIIHNGIIPPKMVVMHICDVKPCVNPKHLKLGTIADNLQDMRDKQRHSHGDSHSKAIKNVWTPELRKWRADLTRQMRQEKELERRVVAGVPLDWKYCGKSSHWLPRFNFGKNAARSDGLNNYCRECRSQRHSDLDKVS
jgi:hypothetical protein